MKVFTQATTAEKTVAQVKCNKCGNEVNKNELGYFDDFLEVNKTWGYHSPMDGEAHDFDVCAECYREWVSTCKIPVK